MGTLTRNDMEQVINAGGSVLHGGKLYTRIADLPNDAMLAEGDPERETAAANLLQQQIANLQAQMEQIQAAQSKRAPRIDPAAGTNDPGAPTIVSLVGQEYADKLAAAGYGTFEAIAQASDEQLLAVDGIGSATVKKLRAAIKG